MPDVESAASSAVASAEPVVTPADRAGADQDFAAYKAARHAERFPESTSDAAAVSSAAKPVDQAVSTETPAAASEPAPPAKNGHKGNADTRVQELLTERSQWRAERQALEARLARLESPPAAQTTTPAPSAEKPATEPEYKRFMAMADAPKLEAFDSLEAYQMAASLFVADKRFAERETAQREHQQQQERATQAAERNASLHAKFETAKARDPEWIPKLQASRVGTIPTLDDLSAATAQGVPNVPRPTALNVLVTEIAQSPLTVELLDHFQAHPDDLDIYAALPNYVAVARELGRLEERLKQPAVGPTPTPIPTLPTPPRLVDTRSTDVSDPVAAAGAKGDFLGYQNAKHRHEPGWRPRG